MAQPGENITRIVILGKTGSGKSSLANTIMGEENVFGVYHTSISGTEVCQSEIRTVNGIDIHLIDTPGFFDTETNINKQEICNCIIESSRGLHAFLLLLKVERYTVHEQAAVDKMVKCFSEDALNYTTLVFTRGEDLPEGMTIEEWVKENEALNSLLQKCGGRCYVFDNKKRSWNKNKDPYRNNQVQLGQMLITINKTVKQNGGVYLNTTLKNVADNLQEETARIRAERADIPELEVEQLAREKAFFSLWEKMALGGAGVALVGALLGFVVRR